MKTAYVFITFFITIIIQLAGSSLYIGNHMFNLNSSILWGLKILGGFQFLLFIIAIVMYFFYSEIKYSWWIVVISLFILGLSLLFPSIVKEYESIKERKNIQKERSTQLIKLDSLERYIENIENRGQTFSPDKAIDFIIYCQSSKNFSNDKIKQRKKMLLEDALKNQQIDPNQINTYTLFNKSYEVPIFLYFIDVRKPDKDTRIDEIKEQLDYLILMKKYGADLDYVDRHGRSINDYELMLKGLLNNNQ